MNTRTLMMAIVPVATVASPAHNIPVDSTAPVMCSKTITIQADPEKVWKVLTEINEWSSWQKDIPFASVEGDIASGSTFKWKTGGAKITSKLHTVKPGSAFGWTGNTMGLYAIHNWQLQEVNGATVVTVAESMDGLLARLFRKSFHKSLEQGMDRWLTMLKEKVESQR